MFCIEIFHFFILCACEGHVYTTTHRWRSETSWQTWSSFSIMRIPRMELGSSGMAIWTFTYWAILIAFSSCSPIFYWIYLDIPNIFKVPQMNMCKVETAEKYSFDIFLLCVTQTDQSRPNASSSLTFSLLMLRPTDSIAKISQDFLFWLLPCSSPEPALKRKFRHLPHVPLFLHFCFVTVWPMA